MRILTIHSDFFEFEPKKKAIALAEETKGKQRIGECLVVFTAVEKKDEKDIIGSAKNLASESSKVAKEVKANLIVLYPYVHLTSEPASSQSALSILKNAEEILKKDFSVVRAPFGWYKAFQIKCKGHPLSELSREFGPVEKEFVPEALEEEKKVKSRWFILEPNGRLNEIEIKDGRIIGFDFSNYENLEKFTKHEIAKTPVAEEPPHVKLMRKLEIADYEEGSDPGNLRFYPKGRLIKSLIEEWVTRKTIDYGAMEVETPVMYDFEHPALHDYLERFPARQYILESAKKEFFLRFSACFGQFLMESKAMISYRDLPLKMYELARSYRLEKAGELAGLRRLRAFTMPDMHTLCKDLEQAKVEFEKQFKLCMECMKDLGLDYETAIRFTRIFYEDNHDFILDLVKLVKKPCLIEMWDHRYAYFTLKFEFNFIDALGRASALSTVQIDVENAERYGIQFTDVDNKRKYPVVLHCSPSGGVERVIYALLEKAYMDEKRKKNPSIPLWLSPVQIRICTVNDSYIKYAEKISKQMKDIRVDIDDRAETISKKIRDAEVEWVPIIVVVGPKELKTKKLTVRIREKLKPKEKAKLEKMDLKKLIKYVKDKTKGYPFKKLPLPKYLTKRPIFVG